MRKRLILLYLALVLLVASLFSWYTYQYIKDVYRNELENRLLDNAALLGELLEDMWSRSDAEAGLIDAEAAPNLSASPAEVENAKADYALKNPFKAMPGDLDILANRYAALLAFDHAGDFGDGRVRITFIRTDGTVLGDSDIESALMENHSHRSEMVSALRWGTGSDERVSETLGDWFLYHARSFPEQQLVIRLALPLYALRVISTDIILTVLVGILLSLVITGALAHIFSKVVTSPVIRLTKQMSELAGQSEKFRLKAPDDRELGSLTRNVNVMADRLEHSIVELEDRNAKVDTIIRSLQNGLIAVDKDLRLVMVNPMAFELFGIDEQQNVLGRPVVEVLRNHTLLEMLESAIKDNLQEKKELTLYDGGKRLLEITVCPILPIEGKIRNTGALAHVMDVTGKRKLEELRSQFVSNVTHELRTPLTSIRGFVETLRAGALDDEEVAARFLDIIDIEAERLSRLIDDTLSLSEIEGMKGDVTVSEFTLAPLADEVVQMLTGAAADRQISLKFEIAQDLLMHANRGRVKQLLINLVDNAIKYNRDQGSILIQAEKRTDGRVEVKVSDTGIGIPEEFCERIFERFYRIDKGRSRAQGGTGLGLSIVKHIVQLYGGSVQVKSELGKGSTFTVVI